jgi:Tol biopolymer transport system component
MPSWAPNGSAVAYNAFPNGVNGEVHVVRLSGGANVVATNLRTVQALAAWAPDSSQIAYPGPGAGSGRDPWVVASDGHTPARQIALPGDHADVDWGKNDQLVTMGSSGLTVCAPDGGAARAIYTQPLGFGVVHWSPDATTILALPENTTSHLLIAADGSNPRQLGGSNGSGGLVNEGEWAPASRQLVYSESASRTGHLLVEVASPDGSAGTVIAQDMNDPVWSPRGDLIAVGGNPNSRGQNQDLEVMHPDGTLLRSVLHVGAPWAVHHPRFSPDGTLIVFAVYGG